MLGLLSHYVSLAKLFSQGEGQKRNNKRYTHYVCIRLPLVVSYVMWVLWSLETSKVFDFVLEVERNRSELCLCVSVEICVCQSFSLSIFNLYWLLSSVSKDLMSFRLLNYSRPFFALFSYIHISPNSKLSLQKYITLCFPLFSLVRVFFAVFVNISWQRSGDCKAVPALPHPQVNFRCPHKHIQTTT